MSEENIIYRGEVFKQGELFKTWKVRKVILVKKDSNLLLRYYQGSNLKGELTILRASDSVGLSGASLSNIYHNKKRCIVIFTKSKGKNRRIVMHAHSDEQTIEFLDTIEKHLNNVELPNNENQRVLVITASPMKEHSASIKVTNAFLDEYKSKNPTHDIKVIDLSTANLPPFSAKRVQAKFATWAGNEEPEGTHEEWGFTKDLIEEFTSADKYVFAVPMWNLGVANQVKLYLDHIVQPWKTFDPTKMPGGLVTGKPALIIAASGSELLGTPYDFVSSYMKAILSFIGFSDIRTVFVSGTANPEKSSFLIEAAIDQAKSIVSSFKFDPENKVDLPTFEIPKPTHSHPIGKKVLAITSSPMGQFSASTTVLNAFLDEYKKKVPDAVINVFDVFQRKLPPFTAERVQAKFATYGGGEAPENLAEAWSFTKELINEFLWADTYVFAVPMWNLAIPNQLKLYIDHIVQPWKTFDPTKMPGGLVTGKPTFLICSAGGATLGTPYDYVTPYLTSILGFIGITDIRKVWINGTASPDGLEKLLETKSEEAISLLSSSFSSFVPHCSLERALKAYETALNRKDIDGLLKLYEEDARLTVNGLGKEDSIGIDQIANTYNQFLPLLSGDIHLEILDIVQYDSFAYAATVVRCNKNNSNSYRETIVMKKNGDDWKFTIHTTYVKFAA